MGSPTGGAAVPGVVATAMAQLAIDVARMEKELDTKQVKHISKFSFFALNKFSLVQFFLVTFCHNDIDRC